MTPEEVGEAIRNHLEQQDCGCSAKIIPGFIVLRIRPEEQHFWSPQLSLSFEKEEHGERTVIRGLYGPNPTVWAVFTFGYAAIGISAMFLGLYGFSKYTLNQDATVLWTLPVLALMALALYIIAQVGQKLGAEQTFALHHFFESSIGQRIHIE